MVDFFNHAAAKGLCPDNPAASTIKRVEKKQRKRHTAEGLKAIREKSPAWLQNAIGLALIIAQRRTDILDMRFERQKICGSCERGHDQKIPARP
ncbi:hypothetical protein [Pseudomonas syringae]|uniref:hypothetical protein n=1 Tax=Pseudomonas syringae TaxID=317 RepID=UPI0038F6F79E